MKSEEPDELRVLYEDVEFFVQFLRRCKLSHPSGNDLILIMEIYPLEKVFNEAEYPSVTFVKPKEYPFIESSFRAKGKHITVAGPSGSGKSTLVQYLLQEQKVAASDVLFINGRNYSDVESCFHMFGTELKTEATFAAVTPYLKLLKFVFVDDFHHLSKGARTDLAKNLKLWFENDVRFIIVGISSSAAEMIGADTELGIRNDPYELKSQDESFIQALLKKGEAALNFKFDDTLRKDIVVASNGIPSVVHVICRNLCVHAGITKTEDQQRTVNFKLKELSESILRVFKGKYFDKIIGLAKGKQQAKSVHNTYFDIVARIASDKRSDIPTEVLYHDIVGKIADSKDRSRKSTSYYNCLKNLSDVIQEKGLGEILFYKEGATVISIEDPSFRFYLNLLDIDEVRRHVNIRNADYPWDGAVSFAGADREFVMSLVAELKKRGMQPFYDFDQQAQLWGKNLRVKLAEVYANEAKYMAIFLSKNCPERDWTQFELAVGKEAAKKRTSEYLLPIRLDNTEIVGLSGEIAYVDGAKDGPSKVADLIEEKLTAPVNNS